MKMLGCQFLCSLCNVVKILKFDVKEVTKTLVNHLCYAHYSLIEEIHCHCLWESTLWERYHFTLEGKTRTVEYFLTCCCQLSRDISVQRRKKDGKLQNISAPPCIDYADQKRNEREVVKNRNTFSRSNSKIKHHNRDGTRHRWTKRGIPKIFSHMASRYREFWDKIVFNFRHDATRFTSRLSPR